jgi:hypothetical protein
VVSTDRSAEFQVFSPSLLIGTGFRCWLSSQKTTRFREKSEDDNERNADPHGFVKLFHFDFLRDTETFTP